jgi:hypothetical protein
MGMLTWLMNLEFAGGTMTLPEPPVGVHAAQARPRGPEAVEVSRRLPQAIAARRRYPEAIEDDIRAMVEGGQAGGPEPDVWTHIILDTNFVHGPTTSVVRVATGLLFTPSASKSYWIKMHLGWTHNTAGLITECGLTFPTGMTDCAMFMESATTSQTGSFPCAAWGQTDGAGVDPLQVQLSGAGSVGTTFFVQVEGLLMAGPAVAGNLEVTIARHTAGGGASTHTLLAGSYIAWQEIP